jgi:hypothetical protein
MDTAQDETTEEAPVKNTSEVTITGVQMPFWSMVGLLLKWAFAAIPAAIVLAIIGFGFYFLFNVAIYLSAHH